MNKFKVWSTFDWLLLILVAFTFMISFYLSPQLPSLVPTHWDFQGQINGWGPKWVNLYLVPTISLAVLLLMSFIPLLDPLKKNYHDFSRQYQAFKALLVGMFIILYLIIIYASLNPDTNFFQFIFPVVFGLFFMGIGWLLPSLKPNWFIGIRSPWTISDPLVWEKTHDLGGKLFIGTGILTILTSLIDPKLSFKVFMILILVSAFGSIAYSFVVWHRLHR